MAKELYIIGAGASHAAAQLPLGRELGWLNFLEGSTSYPDIPGQRKNYFFDQMLAYSYDQKNWKAFKNLKKAIYAHISIKCIYEYQNVIFDNFLKNKNPSETSIITFNFDTLIRDNSENNVYIDYLINFNNKKRNSIFKKIQQKLPLIKLHGSIEWAYCYKCGKLILLEPWVKPETYNNYMCTCGGLYEPFIAVPHENIIQLPVWFQELWNLAAHELKKAEKIYFIGYSFPEYDTEAIKLLQDNIDKDTAIVVVDPHSETVKDRLAELGFKRNNILSENMGFKDYVEKTIQKTGVASGSTKENISTFDKAKDLSFNGNF
ncbi:MAG: hypothetical protein LHV68_04015 [Elusimicrobia bacterium]|nr:hypothetical protein [Candidatus Liberimonas magnetica]